jgi:outer membrane protein OmpA-like peptidoglycan-associated protein
MLRRTLVFATLLWAAPALADDVDVELVSKAFLGKSKPAVVLKVNRKLDVAEVDLKGPGGKRVNDKRMGLKPGSTATFELDAPVGVSHWEGTLRVTFAGGSGGAMPLSFDVETVERFVVQTSYDKLDLKKGEVQIQLTRKAGRCDYDVAVDEKPNRVGTVQFEGEGPGTWLTVGWPAGENDVVLRIALTCWDAENAYHTDTFEMFPWWIEIPHEDVNFETGKWDVLLSEEPKIARACGEIETAVRRYGKVVQVKLYVSGHTDTVGDPASNQTLSQSRARAIAQVFKKRCVKAPIYFVGTGEQELAVETPDETDDIRNRRARYILGVEPPNARRWEKL